MDAVRPLSSSSLFPQVGPNKLLSFNSPRGRGDDHAASVHLGQSANDASTQILNAIYGGGQQSGSQNLFGTGSESAPAESTDLLSQLTPDLQKEALSLTSGLLNSDGSLQSMLDGIAELLAAFSGNGAQPAAAQGEAVPAEQTAAQQGVSASASHFHMTAEFHTSSTTVTSSETGDTVQTQSTDFAIEIEFDQVAVQAQQQNPRAATNDPIVLDLNRDGAISVSDPESGVAFDIDKDGVSEQTAFVRGGDGFLALDRNKNGVLDDGGELFGDQNGSENGFIELGKFDSNNDGKIDAKDVVFSELRIATASTDGNISLHSLSEYGIQSLDLNYRAAQQTLTGGSYLSGVGSYTTADGSKNLMADAELSYRV